MMTKGTLCRENSRAMIPPMRPKPQRMKWSFSSSSMRVRRRRSSRSARPPSASSAMKSVKA